MNFRTLAQMNRDIIAGLPRIPPDVDLIVGVPRSGLLPATVLALYLNVALTDVSGLVGGRLLEAGINRKRAQRVRSVEDARHILVVDDSCSSGSQINLVREKIDARGLTAKVDYAAIYVTPEAAQFVDLYFDICPQPRMFEWNIMHHTELEKVCFDIDGILCVDPTDEENDDGENYRRFLANATPLWTPSFPVGWVVTSRLEKYREQTEAWLRSRGIKYQELVMLNMASAAERRAARRHGSFKAEVYRSKPAVLFIESNPGQAVEITELSGKPVYCPENQQLYLPSTTAVARYVARELPKALPSLGWRLASAVKRRILKRIW